jgi:glycine amidinotransferase
MSDLPVVNSHNEWDPLEEIIVGILDNMAQEQWEIARQACVPVEQIESTRQTHVRFAGRPKREAVAPGAIERAQVDLDGFVKTLEREGVIVRRPDPIDHTRP